MKGSDEARHGKSEEKLRKESRVREGRKKMSEVRQGYGKKNKQGNGQGRKGGNIGNMQEMKGKTEE